MKDRSVEERFDPVWSPDGTQIMFSHFVKMSDGFDSGPTAHRSGRCIEVVRSKEADEL